MGKARGNANDMVIMRSTTEGADVKSSVVVLSGGGTSSTDPIQQARTKSGKSSSGMTSPKASMPVTLFVTRKSRVISAIGILIVVPK